MRWLGVAAILLAGCSKQAPERLDRLYQTAESDVRAGEMYRAQTETDRGLALAVERRDPLFQWRFRLLRAEILLFSRRAEPVLADLSEPIPDAPQFSPLAVRKLMFEARAVAQISGVPDGLPLLERAHRAGEAAQAAEVLAEIESLQGSWLATRDRYEESERILRSAVERARSVHSAYLEAAAVLNLGYIRLRRTRFDDAIPYFEQASRLAGPEAAIYWQAQQNLVSCYNGIGEYDKAIRIGREVIQRHEHSGAKVLYEGALGEVGRSLLYKGELRQAIPYLEQALTYTSETNSVRNAAIWASNLALVYVELDEWNRAESLNEESIRLRKSADLPRFYFNDLNAGMIALGRRNLAESRRCLTQALTDGKDIFFVQWQATEGLGRIALAEGKPAEAIQHFDEAAGIIERTRSGLAKTEFKLPFLSRIIRLYRRYVDTLLQQGQIEQALAVADSSRAQVLAERSGSAPVQRLPPSAFRELARKSNAILLSYWLDPGASHAWVISANEVHHVELPKSSEIESLVAAYQEAVEHQLADPARTKLPAGERLFTTLIEPVRKWIPAGSNVIITPDGVLHGLNLESLPIPGNTPRYWVEDVTVSIAPSLALLAARTERTPSQKRLLLIGDPANFDPSFPPLVHAAPELATVARQFGSDRATVISREEATPDAYTKAEPARFSAIHFTAHALANRESPLDSAVLLAGGKLYGRDVMATPLAADLVTVSACRGVGVRLYSGEGLVGFAWAFLHAGARNVIAGLWDVNDQSTGQLMDVLYRELASGKTPAAALHTAKLALAQSKGNLRKPYYWAPFQLYTVSP
jgi:CHAT domain-containing protein